MRWIILIAVAATLARILTLGLSLHPLHMGAVEVHYEALSDDAAHHPLYPLRTLPLSLSRSLLGDSEAASRLPQALLIAPSVLAAAWAAKGRYGTQAAPWAALAFLATPYAWVWYGRAMPDAWLTTGILLAVAAAMNPRSPWTREAWAVGVLLAVFSKPLGVLVFLTAFLYPKDQRFFPLGFAAFLGASFLFIAGSELGATASYAAGRFQSGHVPFGGAYGVLVLVLAVGALPGVLLAGWSRDWRVLAPSMALGLYDLMDAFPNHGYYALPALALAAVPASGVLAARPRLRWLLLLGIVTVPWGLLASGDLGDDRAGILMDAPPGSTVYVDPDVVSPMLIESYAPGGVNVTMEPGEADLWVGKPGESCTVISSRAYFWETLSLYHC